MRPDEMSTQRRIQDRDLRLVCPVLLTHRAHQAQSEVLADEDPPVYHGSLPSFPGFKAFAPPVSKPRVAC